MNQFGILFTALKLGLISFGGPVTHLSYFHKEYVVNKKWISDQDYADLVALCQFLPGPASSQVGIAIGYLRSGVLGALLSWVGFTLPSAILLILFGLNLLIINTGEIQPWIHGLKITSVAIVAQATLAMGKKFCPNLKSLALTLTSAFIIQFFKYNFTFLFVLLAVGSLSVFYFPKNTDLISNTYRLGTKRLGFIFLLLFIGLLFILPVARQLYNFPSLKLLDSFYRAGALVFGGGHVLLPLLQAEVVSTGWVSPDLFMAGYGVTNLMPGPLYSFTAYLGAILNFSPKGWLGALICLVAAFLPAFLLIIGVLPFWSHLRSWPKVRQIMQGLNAAVVGLLLSTLINPIATHSIFSLKDFSLAAVGFYLLEFCKIPSWAVVIITVSTYILF